VALDCMLLANIVPFIFRRLGYRQGNEHVIIHC